MGRRKLTVARPQLKQDARGNWNVQWTDPATGETVRRGCGTKVRAEAESRMPRIVEDAMRPAPPPQYTLAELIKAYTLDRQQRDHSPSFDHQFRPLRQFFGTFTPQHLTDETYRRYRTWRTQQKVQTAAALKSKTRNARRVSDSTAVRELNALRGALSWGRRNGWTGLPEVMHVPDAPQTARLRFLSRPEFERLLAACTEPHTRLFVLISLATGARMSAVLGLKWTDVGWPVTPRGGEPDEEADLISITTRDDPDVYYRDPETGAEWFRDGREFTLKMAKHLQLDLGRGRGNKRRGLGLVATSNTRLYRELLKAYQRRKSEFVIEWHGKGLSKISLAGAYRRAGIENAGQHVLKHTCVSWLVMEGISYERIAKLVGTSAKTLERHYGHLSPDHLAAVGDILSIGESSV